MSSTTRPPKPYRPGLITRLSDGLRYGGGVGQWSWLAHRLTGVGILFFLIIHVLDTFLVVVTPAWYDHTVALYGGVLAGDYYPLLRWAFRFGELGLIASVVFHAVNGLGVIAYDFWQKGALYRKEIQRVVLVVFCLIMIPATFAVLYPLSQAPGHAHQVQLSEASATKVASAGTNDAISLVHAPRSLTLMFGMFGVCFIWFTVLGFAPPTGMKVKPSSGFELRAWYLMRISGLLLVFLAVGHLFIMHILNNVENISYAFVAERWAAPVTGALWRIWDLAMIALALGHGFNGLRQVLFEYIANPSRRVFASTLIWLTMLTLMGLGCYAIFMFQPDTAYLNSVASPN